MLHHLLFVLFAFSCIAYSCSPGDSPAENPASDVGAAPSSSPLPTGKPYSDSSVHNLVWEEIERTRPLQIDSFRDLHRFPTENFPFDKPQKVDMALVEKHRNIHHPLSKEQQALLEVTDYFSFLYARPNFSAYLFYNRSMESHYSNSIDLITIGRINNEVHKLVLAQEYGNEGQEYEIESEWVSENRIRQVKREFFRLVTGERRDSSYAREIVYQIEKSGKITRAN